MVPTETLEGRLTAVEQELVELKREVAANGSHRESAWWKKMFGSFAASEGFEEAVRQYRESLRPDHDEQNG